jgi:hypothetical protein
VESYNADPTDHVNVDFIDWRERRYFGRSTTQTIVLSLIGTDGVTPVDADGPMMLAYYAQDQTGTATLLWSRTASHVATGMYEVDLAASDTATLGDFVGIWSYQMNSVAESYTIYTTVGESNPAYDMLSSPFKDVVDQVWIRFDDLFDSPSGGPHLQTYYQAHWSRGRMAQLMGMALRKLNTIAQPYSTFSLDGHGGTQFPLQQWGGLLEQATFVEAVKHLRRSYIEQPQFIGGSVTRLDRTDYWQRWSSVLQDEEATLKSQQDTFKISMMMLAIPQVLVAGGTYGQYGPTRIAGSVAARPRYWSRFYS